MSKTMKALVIILILAVLGLGGALAYPYAKKFYTTTTPTKTSAPTATTSSSTTPTSTIAQVSDSGVTWLLDPQKLGDLGLIKKNDTNYVADVSYYKVADITSGGSIIDAVVPYDSPGSPDLLRFRKDSEGIYHYLIKQSTLTDYTSASEIVSDMKNYDNSTLYQSLSPSAFLKIGSSTFKMVDQSSKFYKDLISPTEVGNTEYGKIYKVATGTITDNKEGNGYTFDLKLADSSIVNYTIKFDFQTDDEVSLITWKDGTKNSAKYTPEGYTGCSLSSNINMIANTNNINSRLTEAGKITSSNEKIYTVSKDDAIMASAYENYKSSRTEGVLSLDQFAAKKPVFIYKDKLNQYVVFTGREFAGLAECGKPVIYLYPTKDTQVSVKVGADITKSEPLYLNGWTNVLANPSGKLMVDGKYYDSLFWEGLGFGNYPAINQGFVVKHEDLKSTLLNQLAEQGLNAKESADFMDFWWPKMPQTPYVRLTWFGTSQMNELAPLFVSPKPDSMIRIFLDFAGLEKPINLEPQHLSAPNRNGFTLVEWGGLLK